MFNILICEDEPPILRVLEKKIKSISSSYHIIGKAMDGQKALEILQEGCVDILVTDMNIPLIEGTKLLKIVKTNYPNVLSIVVSGYQDFKFLQSAIREGAVDYLLKPVKIDELDIALSKCVKIIRDREKIENESYFNQALRGCKIDSKSSLSSEKGLAVLINVGNNLIHNRMDLITFEEEIFLIQNKIELYFDNSDVSSYIIRGKGTYTFIFLDNYFDDALVTSLFYKLQSYGFNQPISEIFIETDFCVEKIRESTNALINKMKTNLIFTESALYRNLETKNGGETPSINEIVVIKSIKNRDKNLFMKALSPTLNDMAKSGATLKQMKEILSYIYFIMIKNSSYKVQYSSSEFVEYLINNSFSYDELKESLGDMVDPIFINEGLSESHEMLVKDVAKYLEDNYGEAISNKDIGNRFCLVSSYINRIFKAQIGVTISEYLTEIRINRAKELLENNTLLLRDIAINIGYSDSLYFSRVFKKKVGMSPSEYKESLSEK
jgi:YesN/AraC family two-component response regulator